MSKTPFTTKSVKESTCGHLNGHLLNYTELKKSKYGNKKTEFEGMVFDSKKELARFLVLRMRVTIGEITDLRRQVEYVLKVKGEKICSYWADFDYKENGVLVVEDVKSVYTRKLPVYRLKKKLMKQIFNIEIKET